EARSFVDWLVAGGKELEGELEMRFRLAAVRVDVAGVERQRRVRLQQTAGLRREDVRVAADLVNRPAARELVARAALAHLHARVRHVMEQVASADRRRAPAARDVVDLANFDGGDVSVFGEAGRDEPEV